MQYTFILRVMVCSLALSLGACVYHPPIQQGNVMEAETLQKLHKGMSVNQVISLLGNPVLTNVFKGNELVYVYTFKSDDKPFQEKQLSVYFNKGTVSRYVAKTLPETNSKK